MLSSMPHAPRGPGVGPRQHRAAGLAAMRAFQDAASELALLRRRMYHSAADEHAVAQERELLARPERAARRVRRAMPADLADRAAPTLHRRDVRPPHRPALRGDRPAGSAPPARSDLRPRRLHRIPEVGLHLPDTQAAVLEALSGSTSR